MELNKQIINSDICLFLGAGASAPFGKALMGSFIDNIYRKNLSNEPKRLLDFLCKVKAKDLEEVLEDLNLFIEKEYYLKADYFADGSRINDFKEQFANIRDNSLTLNSIIRKETIVEIKYLKGK